MSLPTPNLDDRKFQEIVDDVKRQIGLRCPEWTDHNVSDPGVTLLELFASMVETALFRMNQVPDKNYIKFLEMIGISLEMPEPARTDLRFRLTRPIEDEAGEEQNEMLLPARLTVAATMRTETEDPVEFTSDADLKLVRPKVAHVFAVQGSDTGEPIEDLSSARDMPRGKEPLKDDHAFKVFSAVPKQGDCVYVAFENDVSGNIVEFQAHCLTAAATGLRESYPAQVWEVWNGVESSWDRLEVLSDTTFGWNRTGAVALAMPRNLMDRMFGDRKGYFIRCRYTLDPRDVPPKGIDQRGPDPYQKTPEVTFLHARTIGGDVPASQCTCIFNEVLGVSDGMPGQSFTTLRSPILQLGPEDVILVGTPTSDPADLSEFVPWTRVDDFSESGPEDRHFVCDNRTGTFSFGPNLVQPDGSSRQYGAIPEKGLTIAVSCYRVGGGAKGNVRDHKVRILKSNYPYIADVTNPRPAAGGRDLESLERAKLRALEVLKVRNRAVTAEDFEFLALKASSGVGRARCVQPLTYPSRGADTVPPGVVKVLIVPALNPSMTVPRPSDLRVPERTLEEVRQFLDERRLLTTVLEIGEPEYVFVSTEIRLVADPRADPELVVHRVRDALNRFVHPLWGGPAGEGWPFRRSLSLADVYAQVGDVRGVAFLLDAKMFTSKLVDLEQNVLGPEEMASNADGVRIGENQILATREHRIRVLPMSAVGSEEEAAEVGD